MHKNNYIIFALIVVVGIVFRIICFVGLSGDDPYFYANYALQVLEKNFDITNPDTPFIFRYIIIYPVALFFKLFGIKHFSAVLFILLLSVAEIIIIFLLGKKLFNEKIGLISSFLLVFIPVNSVYATQLLPDIPISFFMSFAILLFLIGIDSSYSIVYYFLSGCLIYCAYICRSISLIMIGTVFIGYIIYNKKMTPKFIFVIIGFLIPFILTSMWYYFNTGDFLFDYHFLRKVYHYKFSLLPKNLFSYLKIMFPIISFSKKIPHGFYHNGLLYYFVTAYIIYYLIRRKYKKINHSNINFCILWSLIIFIYLEFGLACITYTPLDRKIFTVGHIHGRFLAPLTIPALILLANFFCEFTSDNLLLNKAIGCIYKKCVNKNLSLSFIIIFIFLIIFLLIGKNMIFSLFSSIYSKHNHVISFQQNKSMFFTLYYILLLILGVATLIFIWIRVKYKNLHLTTFKEMSMTVLILIFITVWAFLASKQSQNAAGVQPYKKDLPIFIKLPPK